MSMDAHIVSVFTALAKKALPELYTKLGMLAKKPAAEREPDQALVELLAAVQTAVATLQQWASPDLPDESAMDLSDDDAMALLQDVGSTSPVAGPQQARDDDFGEGEEVDADAAAMLAAMAAPAAATAVPATAEGISDADAMAMLAAMDAPAAAKPAAAATDDMSDADAMAMLAAMDAPLTANHSSPAGVISDAEAMALLNAMDAPLAPATQAKDMSDAEARALLDAMDAPAAVASPQRSAPPPPAAMSAEDEALAMLASLGGAEGDGESRVPKPPAPAAPEPEAHASGEALSEIDEFAKNDFASDPEMLNDFVTNADELMETLDEKVLHLEQNPRDKETIEAIFRAAHTLKGAGGMFGFKALERVMHRMENLFDLVRKGTLVTDSNLVDVLFQGLDVLRALLAAVKTGKPSGMPTVPICTALELACQGRYVKGAAKAAAPAPAKASAAQPPASQAGAEAHPAEGDGGGKKKSAEQSTIRVDLERLDALVNLVGELVIDRTRFATIEEDIRTTSPQLKVSGNMTETVQLFGRHMNEIHEIIMKIRMVPSTRKVELTRYLL